MQNLDLAVERIEDRPDQEIHPFEYFATCPTCKTEIPEHPSIKNLYKAWLHATGTKSPEISSKNLPSPDSPRRKFNALKSGLFAKKAKYFPAKVGRYPECDGCEHSNECEEIGICLQISKLKMMVTHAFDTKDPGQLQPLFQETQADFFVLLRRLFSHVFKHGEILEAPVWHGMKSGYTMVKFKDPVTGKKRQLMQYELHPAVRAIFEMLQKNALSLADLNLTPKTEAEHSATMGHLRLAENERESLQEHRSKMVDTTRTFLEAMAGAGSQRRNDPIYLEHQEENGGGD